LKSAIIRRRPRLINETQHNRNCAEFQPEPFGRARFHIIEASPIMEKFPMSSKPNSYPPLLEYLFNLGRQTGDAWIAQNGDALGQRSTMDVQQLLPGGIWDNI
jgi:hypothetical protein